MEPLLNIRGLRVDFNLPGRSFSVLKDLHISIGEGEVLALVGESGSGKTLTALSIMQLLPEGAHILEGEIWFKGTELTSLPEKEMRRFRGREIGMVFQEPGAALNPVFSIGYQIAEPLIIHYGLSRKTAMNRVKDIMKQVGLPPELYHAYPHMLSGGQRQRAVIGMAVAADPSLLIADEPTTALDVTVEAQIMDLFVHLREERGLSILFISHNIELVAQIADIIVIMYAGRIQERGPINDVINNPLHPYTQGLMKSIPRRGHKRLPQIPGNVPPLWDLPSGCTFKDRCKERYTQCDQEPPLVEIAPGRWVRCWGHQQ